jgi:MMP 1-O-methyltransferase
MSLDHVIGSLRVLQTFMQTEEKFRQVPGFLHPLEGFALSILASHGEGPGEIVEIGSFKGRSTCFLAFGSKHANRGKVTAIDHFKGSAEHQPGQTFADADIARSGSTFGVFEENLRTHQLLDMVTAVKSSSVEAAKGWTKPVGLLFIDGDHAYEATRLDFETWSKFVPPGGYVAFHDVGPWPGVTKFVEELTAAGPPWRPVFGMVSLRVFQRQA